MSKQKLLYYIETQMFDLIQQLSIFVYTTTINNKSFNFDKYIETTLNDNISKSLNLLEINNIDLYKEIFYKYLKDINDISIENGINFLKTDISNKKILFDYWFKYKKIFLSEIIEIYKIDKNT